MTSPTGQIYPLQRESRFYAQRFELDTGAIGFAI